MGCVYSITNTINGKQYIGKTIFSSDVRWRDHVNHANSGNLMLICKAIRKHGENVFKIEILEESDDEKVLFEREIYWIKQLKTKFPNGYNQTDGGDGNSGWSPSQSTRNKIRLALTGKRLPEEVKKKMSESHKGKIRSESHKKALSESQRGKPKSQELKRKISEGVKSYYRKLKEENNDKEV